MGTDDIKAIVNQQFETTIRDLKNLVTIPGIAWDNFDQEHLRRSASAVKALVDCLAFDTVEILRASYSEEVSGAVRNGAPAVVATKKAAEGRPTVLLYAHHDVQPPQDAGLWDTPPFEPAERQGRLFGRGAADDKAGVMLHIAAVRALEKAIGKDHGLGIKLFIEGEEEAGSPSFSRFLDAYAERLSADIIVVADSANWDVGTPALTTSLRGLADGTFEVRVLEHAVHSGMFGGIVLDPLVILSKLIATLHDEKGNVAIAGLASYDASGIDFEEGKLRKDGSVLPGVRFAGEGSFTSRLWTKPALTIIGIDAPATAEASNTLLPSAKAKFSLRLAPGQDPRQAMEAVKTHMERHIPCGAELVFRPGSIGEPFKMDVKSSPAAALALKNLSVAWGSPAVEVGIGGSIPFIADLKRIFPHAQVLITGVEDPDSRAHSANESLHLGEYKKAVTAESLLLAEFATLQAEDVLPAGASLRINKRN